MDYARLRRRLETPKPRVIADFTEFLHPHTAPDDPQWPIPTQRWMAVMTSLGHKLSWTAALVCGITAGEMVLGRIERTNGPEHPQVAPIRHAIERAYEFLAGDASFAEFWRASRAFPTGEGEHLWVFEIFVHIFESEWFHDDRVAETVQRWWQRCRSRLAVRDGATFDDEWVIDELDAALDDPLFRAEATRQLEFFKAPSTFRTLVNLCRNDAEHYDVRIAAIESLKTFNELSDVPTLIESLRDRDEWVRFYAFHRLAGISVARRQLRAASMALLRYDPSPQLREMAAQALRTADEWTEWHQRPHPKIETRLAPPAPTAVA